MREYLAFTLKSKGLLNRLPTSALILSNIRDNSTELVPKLWSAIWDTGATKSCITKRVAEDLKLIPVGKTTIGTANGNAEVDTYFIDIGLPNGMAIQQILVSCADLGQDIDVLIGMDIISLGDFSITNFNGRTTFTFRIPSIVETDFVEEYKKEHKQL